MHLGLHMFLRMHGHQAHHNQELRWIRLLVLHMSLQSMVTNTLSCEDTRQLRMFEESDAALHTGAQALLHRVHCLLTFAQVSQAP